MANSDTGQIVPPPTPMKITQIAVVVRDMEAALKSYTETMGWDRGASSTTSRRCCTTRGCTASRSSTG
jgi:hypothetical protein